MIVSTQVRTKRLLTCQACEYYTKVKTCGTPLIGQLVDGVKLCGCVMPVATKLKVKRCPLGKWNAEVSGKQMEELRVLILSIQTKGHNVNTGDAKLLEDWWNKNVKPISGACLSCNFPAFFQDCLKMLSDWDEN